jgi:DNA-binding Lrp family transcriptional regulator
METVTERKRSTVRDLRRDNRSVLLWSLFFGQPCSRQDLSEATGLSTASVSNVVRELIGDGIVTEAGSVDSDGGRPRVLLRMDPDFGRVIGVDVGETRVRVEMFDMTMAVRAAVDYPLDPNEHGIDVVVDRVSAGLASVLADGADGDGSTPAVLGAGIGVPGVVEQEGQETLVRSGVCSSRPETSRCASTTGRRRWDRPSSGSAPGAARARSSCA